MRREGGTISNSQGIERLCRDCCTKVPGCGARARKHANTQHTKFCEPSADGSKTALQGRLVARALLSNRPLSRARTTRVPEWAYLQLVELPLAWPCRPVTIIFGRRSQGARPPSSAHGLRLKSAFSNAAVACATVHLTHGAHPRYSCGRRPPLSRFPDRHFFGFPCGYAFYPSAQVPLVRVSAYLVEPGKITV